MISVESQKKLIKLVSSELSSSKISKEKAVSIIKKHIGFIPLSIQELIIKDDVYDIELIPKADKSIQLKAVKIDPEVVWHIKHPCKEALRLAMDLDDNFFDFLDGSKKNGVARKKIHKFYDILVPVSGMSLKDQELFVAQKVENIGKIIDPCEQVQYAAVSANPRSIIFIQSPCLDVCKIVIDSHPWLMMYVQNISEPIQDYFVSINAFIASQCIFYPCESAQLKMVQKNVNNICFIENPTLKVQKYVLDQSEDYIRLIKSDFLNDSVALEVIKKRPDFISYIKNPSVEIQDYIVSVDSVYVYDIDSEVLCRSAVLSAITANPRRVIRLLEKCKHRDWYKEACELAISLDETVGVYIPEYL